MADPHASPRFSGDRYRLELVALLAFITVLAILLEAVILLPVALAAVGIAWCLKTGAGNPPRPIAIPIRTNELRK